MAGVGGTVFSQDPGQLTHGNRREGKVYKAQVQVGGWLGAM